jgi:DNA helicase-2/ATP-dependent DNA helicase PcrA
MSSLLKNLNNEQLAAVKYTDGPLLIVAGAGTGKTTVITRRIAHLIEQNLAKPEEILALTFTDKAATEMQERVDLLLPIGYVDTWISTFHSFCERILKNHALDIGLPNDFELLDGTKQWMLVHKNFEKFDLDYYRPLGNPSKFISALLSHFSKCKDEVITPEEYLKHAEELTLFSDSPQPLPNPPLKKGGGDAVASSSSPFEERPGEVPKIDLIEISRLQEVANAYHVYQKLLLDNSCLDFGDLINYTLELFKKRPNILKYYQNRFKYIMVDEFQDTNFAQYQLVKMLAGENQNIAVVGDDDQSIYKFRGASFSNILKFKDNFPKLKEITLVENYRSTKNILDLSYKFIQQNNPDRLEIKLQIKKELKSNTPQNGIIEVIEAEDLSSELNTVAKKILELKNTKNTWNDFAILVRSNSAAEEVLPILAANSIPHTFYANTGLYKKPIILDLLAYIKLLTNVHDSFSLYRVLNMHLFKLNVHEIATILEYSKKKTLSLYETLEQMQVSKILGQESIKKISVLLENLKKHHSLAQLKGAAECFVEIVKDLRLAEKVEEDTSENVENRELIEQFYKKIENFEKENADKSFYNFLTQLRLEEEAGDEGKINFNPNLGPESLKVMTIHSAKGLEFENVFVINLVDKRFPSVSKKDPIEIPKKLIKDILPEGDFHIQEERRLFYVAVTRAKVNLYLTWAKDYGGKQQKKPSQFLVEAGLIPSEKLSRATGKVVFNRPKISKSSEVFKILPDKFSYSQLKDFENCPLKYKYQYYLKLPVKGSQYLSFGNTVHKVFEEYLKLFISETKFSQQDLFGQSKKAPALPKFEVLEKLYEKNWVDEWYPSKKEKELFYKQGKEMLKKFYDLSQHNLPKPKYIEQSFFLFLGDYKLVGRIDRADEAPEGLIIYDYKTGKKPRKSEKRDIDQLYIYQWAAQEYLKEKVSGLKYWFLRENEEQFLTEELADSEKINELKKELLSLMDKITKTIKFDLFKEEHEKCKDHNCEFEYLEAR